MASSLPTETLEQRLERLETANLALAKELKGTRRLLDLVARGQLELHEALIAAGPLAGCDVAAPHAHATPLSHRLIGSDRLVLVFGSRGGGSERDEFLDMLAGLGVDFIVLRDFRLAWFTQGLLGVSGDVQGAVAHLKALIAPRNYCRIVACGVAMGGYGAILYGVLMGADHILAFSPQTKLSKDSMRPFAGDQKVRPKVDLAARYADLTNLLDDIPFDGAIDIHYGAREEMDRDHAQRLAGLNGVELHPIDTADRNVASLLKAQGKLTDLFRAALAD